jgi:hypothetical protein
MTNIILHLLFLTALFSIVTPVTDFLFIPYLLLYFFLLHWVATWVENFVCLTHFCIPSTYNNIWHKMPYCNLINLLNLNYILGAG